MATHRFIKSAVEMMEHLVQGAVKKFDQAVCAIKQHDDSVESDVKQQGHAFKRADKKRVQCIEAAVKENDHVVQEKDHVVQGAVKVHNHATKDATAKQFYIVEVAVIKQDRSIKDTDKKRDNAVKGVDEEQDFYEGLEDFRRKYSAEAKASRHYKRPGLLTIKEEDETRDGEPMYNFLEIFQKNKYGKPRTLSRLDPPVLLSPISSIASTIPPEPCLLSKCCARIGKNARRNKRKVKRVSKEFVEKLHLQCRHIRTPSLWDCIKECSHPSRTSPYEAAHPSHHQSDMYLTFAKSSSFELPPLVFCSSPITFTRHFFQEIAAPVSSDVSMASLESDASAGCSAVL
ncbi:hypothetical protein SEPCBS57363_001429 [Sporothrix epigloea]|uniref:Uncharacterized protein n=1 Tax=Sporothrix epigloea TaxID=1892477 RepID=A0ABP0DA81_9PEZI